MVRIASAILDVLQSKPKYPISRTSRIATYCRLCAKRALVRASILKPSKENLFGYTLALGDYRSFVISYEEIFMAMEYHFVSSTPAPLIIDAGSNIGMAALFFTILYPQSRIICFEPGTSSYRCLQQNIRANRLDNVTAYPYALDARADGEVALFSAVGTSLKASVIEGRDAKAATVETVRTATLSSHIHEPVEMLKMDVEGAEHNVALDLGTHGKWTEVRQAIIEYHHHIRAGDDRLGEFLGQLQEAGFRYQIRASFRRPLVKNKFQNIMIFAYR